MSESHNKLVLSSMKIMIEIFLGAILFCDSEHWHGKKLTIFNLLDKPL